MKNYSATLKCVAGPDLGELVTIETNWMNLGDTMKYGDNTFKVVYISAIA